MCQLESISSLCISCIYSVYTDTVYSPVSDSMYILHIYKNINMHTDQSTKVKIDTVFPRLFAPYGTFELIQPPLTSPLRFLIHKCSTLTIFCLISPSFFCNFHYLFSPVPNLKVAQWKTVISIDGQTFVSHDTLKFKLGYHLYKCTFWIWFIYISHISYNCVVNAMLDIQFYLLRK